MFSFPAMLITGLFASPFFASLDVQHGSVLRDPDIWWHLRNAEVLLSSHHFIRQDMFSFTTYGQPWINHEWLAEIPYYLGYQLLGERGLFLVMLAAVELVIAGVLLLCYRRTGDAKAAFLASWVAVLFATVNIGPRTILFGWICFLAEMLLLEAFCKGSNRLWLLAPLFGLWINLHGSWLIGLAFFVLFVASGMVGGKWGWLEAVRWTPRQLRNLIAVGAASVAMLLVNPYGWRLVAYPFDMIFRQRLNVAVVDEWRGLDFQSFHGVVLFAVAGFMLVVTLTQRRHWALRDLLFVLFAFYAALTHRRFLFLAGMVASPMLAEEFAGAVFSPYEKKRDRPLLNAAIMAAFCFFAMSHIPSSAALRGDAAREFPVAAIAEFEHCCNHGRLLNRYEWGGYMIWTARATPVFIDSRTDIFEYHGVLADYLNAVGGHDSLATLDGYRIEAVLLTPDAPLVYLLERTPGWRVQYEDTRAVLLVRTGLGSAVRDGGRDQGKVE